MSLTFVVPGDVERPTGGNLYDLRLSAALRERGVPVRLAPVPGRWPPPPGRRGGPAARAALDAALAATPVGGTVLLDGLVAGAVPEVVAGHAARRRLVVVVHLPLAAASGLAPARVAELRAAERRTLAAAAAVVATSGWTADRLAGDYGVGADRLHVVGPGTHPAPPAVPAPAGDRLLCVAAVIPSKGQAELVEALHRLGQRSWTCRCVGPLDRDPGYAARVRRRARGLGGRLTLTGTRTGAALDAEWAAADLMVLASHGETYGMAVAEALARGLPVLSTTGSAVQHTVGDAGLLVPPGDPDALARALARWLDDPDLRAGLRARAGVRGRALPTWADAAEAMARVLG